MFNRISLGAITAGLVIFATHPAQSGPAGRDANRTAPNPRAVLQRVLLAEERVPFSARQTVVLSNHGRAEATVTDEINYGYARGITTYVLPESALGRKTIRNGKRRWTIEPKERAVITSEVVHRPVTLERARTLGDQVERSYYLTVSPETTYIAGRKVTILTLSPKSKDRQKRVWWVDDATGLVLKREAYSTAGVLEQSISFGNLKVNIHPEPSSVTPRLPRGYKVIERPLDHAATDITSARLLDPSLKDLPSDIGAGFVFESARLVDANGMQSVQIQYSDGLAGVSVFRIPARTRIPSLNGQPRTVSVGSFTGRLIDSVSPYRILTWEAAGITFNLVSDISEKTMIALARSFR